MQISTRSSRIKPSPTMAVTAKAAELRRQGKDVIGLGAGEPDFPTPEHIKQAAIQALSNNQTRYTAVDGTPELKAAIINKLQADNGLTYQDNQILVSSGCKQSIFNLMLATLNPGDEVIIPAPYWVSYPDMALIAEAEPVCIATSAAQKFKLTPQDLAAAITPKTRLLLLNSPSNPTGSSYTKSELLALAQVLLQHSHVMIASDDIYEKIIWADEPFCNIATACSDLVDRTFVLNGVSKAYAMTGWRIGYAAGPAQIIKEMKKIQSQSTSNACSISQAAAAAAISGTQQPVFDMVKVFEKRHTLVLNGLNALPGVSCNPADGAFYSFADFSEAMAVKGYQDDIAFAEHILQEAQVALVPGSAFGAPGFMRLSFATSEDLLKKALERLAELLK